MNLLAKGLHLFSLSLSREERKEKLYKRFNWPVHTCL